jgi:homoserine dehydrogenase
MVAFSIQTAESKILVPSIDNIPRDSIRNITNNDLQRAFEDGGKKFRLVASAGEHKAAVLLNTFHQIQIIALLSTQSWLTNQALSKNGRQKCNWS